MSRIDELIRELCGDRVEYRALADVTTYVRGITYKKSDEADSGEVKVLRSNNINVTSNTLNFDDVRTIGSHVAVRPNQWLRRNDILMSAASGSRSHVGKVAFVDADIDFCFGGFMAVIRSSKEVEPRFLFHVLTGRAFADYLDTALSSSTINNLSASLVGGFSSPIPPLPVQEEIIRILDTFTELGAELEAELEARTTQYEETRNRLMAFDEVDGHPLSGLIAELCPNGITSHPLGEVAEYVNGKAHEKLVSPDGAIPLITARFISRNGEANRFVSPEDVKTPTTRGDVALVLSDLPNGRALARTFYIEGENSYAINQRIARLRVRDRKVLNPKFMYYLLNRNPGLLQHDNGVDQTHLSKSQVVGLRLPLPPLPVQEEIVRILDGFEALVTDLSAGLPAEIAARRKQYEYYRDKLLSFEDVAA